MTGSDNATKQVRARLHVEGTVQGVGFRPYVYRLATDFPLRGFVRNDSQGAIIEVQGHPDIIDAFLLRLVANVPPLAQIDRIVRLDIAIAGDQTFRIINSRPSQAVASSTALVPPDMAPCDACLREMLDQGNRRYRYPFINCTDCGPRFTIIRGTPYDRSLTTMSVFTMCADCQREYEDPGNRRFHAQPNACARCGPRLRFTDANDAEVAIPAVCDPLTQCVRRLRDGAIVALKGVGGFHLACRADDENAVQRLRARKLRPHKPFALMVADLAAARALVRLTELAESLLVSNQRPIVLASRLEEALVAESVAPGLDELGVMLPSSPLHHLLLNDVGTALVMTSGNLSDEPIAFHNADALTRLTGIADYFLTHDRAIETPADDSVLRVVSIGDADLSMMIRRSRGFAPSAFALPVSATEPTLGCGAQLKSTYAIARGTHAWVGPHVGDLGNYEAFEVFRRGIAHHERLFGINPTRLAHDLHPEYLSTKYAAGRAGADDALVGVQHHHAHFAACLAEHGLTHRVLGIIFDGSGLGTDGQLWGGEILAGDLVGFQRVAHLRAVPMPGGQAAVREPWRMACAWLNELGVDEYSLYPAAFRALLDERAAHTVVRLARNRELSPMSTSAGRLLDAIAALCGVRGRVTYEGQAAIELEAIADEHEAGAYNIPLCEHGGVRVLDTRLLIRGVLDDLAHGVEVPSISARAHNSLAVTTAQCCAVVAAELSLDMVIISGGVFQNLLLLERTAFAVRKLGLRVLIPERIPPNDGGIAFGQLAVASARASRSNHHQLGIR